MSKRKLLLADDSITIQKVVNLTFADEGIEVISVGDGDSAMRKFDEFMPDLVMADVNMPGINGYEVCRIIKQTEETRHIPVILLVGSFEPFDEQEAKNVGADDFLTKPFQSIRQLVNKVTDLLNQGERAAEESPAEPAGADSFADTLEFENRDEQPQDEFGDAGMDDEMIETSPANDYVSDTADSVYQGETSIDYAKTQPLNAEDLKGFDIISGEQKEESDAENLQSSEEEHNIFETDQPAAQAEHEQTSEPPSFDEEARKLDYYDPSEETDNLNEYAEQKTPNINEYSFLDQSSEETPDNISETEPQIDYALSGEPEFEKELTDAETLAPEVSTESETPREADFSQSEPDEEPPQIEQQDEESRESAETSDEPMSESDFAAVIQPPQPDEIAPPTEAESEKAEETQDETQIESESEAEETEAAASFDETTAESDLTETAENEESQKAEEAREPEMIDETPISSTSTEMPPIDFADDDLLDLPPLVEETGIRPQSKPAPLVPEVVAPQEQQAIEPESKITVTKTVAESEIALSFPPELIEAIAQKVADKISANTMNEVLPQLADLVVKKLAERESKK